MNAVILIPWNCEDETQATYICSYILGCTCRMDLIQSALDRGVSKVSQKNLFVVFGPFLQFLGRFEAKSFTQIKSD